MARKFNSIQFAAAMRSFGFVRSLYHVTRQGLSYTHPADPSGTLWTVGRGVERAMVTGASRSHRPAWGAPIGISSRWLATVQTDPAFRAPLDRRHPDNETEDDFAVMTPREIFLCAARAFAETIPAGGAV